VHPLDLVLRDLGLTGSYGIATYVGRPMRDHSEERPPCVPIRAAPS
jgi:hypothetical protein